MAQNPLSGHTSAGITDAQDGLRDGDHILSPSLTNLYEGVHGNGILLSNDTSYGNADRNNPNNLGGAVRKSSSVDNQVIVKPFEAILDGVLYDFGGGSETTLTFATGDSNILDNTNVTALSASGKETLFIILATSEGLKYTQTAVIDTATGAYPSVTGDSAEYLKMDTVSSASNKQTLVLATVRAVRTDASTTGTLNISSITEVNDKRVFVRPSPVYFTPVQSGGAGSEVGITDHTTLLQIHGSGEHGSTTTESGVLWQSYNADGDAHLYFSAKDSQSTRHTHLIGPTGIKTTTADADMTFTFDEAQVFVLTPSTTIDLDPSGNFPPGHSVFVSNVSASNSIEFDDVGATATISFTGACTVDETIVIIDTAGTSRTYTAKSSTTAASLQFINTDAAAAATALKTCIEHANGHNGTITVTDNGSGTLTLTQATGGTAGNTIITSGLTNVTVTNFTGAGVKDTVSPLESCMFVYGESGAQAVLTVTDGDADVTTDEADEITLISTDGTSKTYFITDTNAGGVATGTVLVSGSDIGSTTAGGNAGKIAVGIATTGGSKSTQNALLVQLKAAIEHANGHNGKITVSAVPTEANGNQSITLTQATGGTAGNRTITETIDDITKTDFTGSGWQRVMVSSSTPTPVSSGASGDVQRSDGSGGFTGDSNLNFNGSTLAVTGALTTTTTATVGTDLTVTGGDIGFGNGQDATVSVAATTSTTAGRDLTISAGSTSTNGNNINGGDLVLKSGGGDGTGTSAMTFHTKVSGTDTAAERMRIHTDGNVGIGTNAPTTLLEVKGDTTLARSADNSETRTLVLEGARFATGSAFAQIDLKNYDSNGPTSYVGARIASFNEATGVDDGNLVISTSNAGSLAERMRIKDSGEVVIGTDLQLSTSSDDVIIQNVTSDKDIILQVNDGGSSGTEVMRIDGSESRVGIGATAPSAKLEVSGDTTISRTSNSGETRTVIIEGARNATGTDYARIDLKNYDSHGPTSYVGARISALNEATGVDDGTLTFSTNNANAGITERMRITDEGSVGIGITTPSAPLHVLDSGTGDTLILESTAANAATHAPNLVLYRNGSDTPLTNELVGEIKFRGENDNNQDVEYGTIQVGMDDVADGSEDGNMTFNLMEAGTLTEFMRLRAATRDVVINDQHDDIDFRVEGDTDENLFFCDASADKVGISTSGPKNMLQVNVTGADGFDGIQIVRDDSSDTETDEILGGIGFDSNDGNVPSSITEASAFIASYATENHSAAAKGGRLKLGITEAGTADDQTSTVMANIGPPITTANTTSTGSGLNSRATTAVIGAATYAPTVEDSGTLVIFNNSASNLTLPSINNTTSVGVQFTVFNQTGSTISAQIAVSNSATINGAAATDADDIESFKAATFVCSGNNTWIRIG